MSIPKTYPVSLKRICLLIFCLFRTKKYSLLNKRHVGAHTLYPCSAKISCVGANERPGGLKSDSKDLKVILYGLSKSNLRPTSNCSKKRNNCTEYTKKKTADAVYKQNTISIN